MIAEMQVYDTTGSLIPTSRGFLIESVDDNQVAAEIKSLCMTLKGETMFNFAVGGSLERYQPIQREPAIRPVDQARATKKVASLEAGNEDVNFEISEESPQTLPTKPLAVRGYVANASSGQPQQRKRAWIVADLMTKSVKTLRSHDSISTAKSLLEGSGFRHIPIISTTKFIEGLVSDRDLLRLNEDIVSAPFAPISTIMTTRVLTCFPETPLRLAAHTMLEEGFSSLPVVDPEGVLLGILTTGDILMALVNEAPVEIWA